MKFLMRSIGFCFCFVDFVEVWNEAFLVVQIIDPSERLRLVTVFQFQIKKNSSNSYTLPVFFNLVPNVLTSRYIGCVHGIDIYRDVVI